MTNLKDKVAVITGAANGLGKALAIELYKQSCHLALMDIDFDGLQKLKAELQTGEQMITIHRVDISKENEITSCKEEILRIHHHINIIINNAGVSISRFLESTNLDDFKWLFNINFWGTVYCTKHFLSELKKQNRSHIVNIISDFALMGFPGKTAYASSKSAVMGFTNSLKTELYGSPVYVSLVIPPPLATGLVLHSKHIDDEKRKMENEFLKKHEMAIEKVAAKIIRKVRKGKYRIVIGKFMFWTDLTTRLFPTMVHNMIGKNRKKIKFI